MPPVTTTSFGPLAISYDDRVLEPRPWTLLHSAWAAATPADGPVLELCAGAGQIGLAATHWCPRPIVQVDASPAACRFARRNAAVNGLGRWVDVRCDTIAGTGERPDRYAVVIADPPYLPSARVADFPADPVRAIDGGPDGLELTWACVETADRVLTPGGRLLLQVLGAVQAEQLARRLASTPTGLRVARVCSVDPARAVAELVRA